MTTSFPDDIRLMDGDAQPIPDAQPQVDRLMNEYFIDPPVQRTDMPSRSVPTIGTSRTDLQRMAHYIAKVGNETIGNRDNAAFNIAGNLLAFPDASDNDVIKLMIEWDKGNDPPLGEAVIQAKVRSAKVNGTPREPKKNRPPVAPTLQAPDSYVGPHGIELTPTNARTVGKHGKQEVAFDVEVNGKPQAPLTITTSASSIRDASRDLASWVELAHDVDRITNSERVKVHQFVATTMKAAAVIVEHFKAARQSQPKQIAEGPTMQSIIINEAPMAAGLTFKELDGRIWSETEARPIDTREFQNWMTLNLVRLCEQAFDYPEDRIGRSAPVGTLRQYLPMAWNNALACLPCEVKADNGPDSQAARRYAGAIVRLFSIREKWRKTYARDGSDQAMDSATLAQIAREKIEAQPTDKASGWQRIHNSAVDAWFSTTPRYGSDKMLTGELPDPWLAFRYELVNQLPKHSRPDLPNTRDQNELTRIANRYELTAINDPTSPTSIVKEHGKQRRVVILNRDLTNLILWQWDDGTEPDERTL